MKLLIIEDHPVVRAGLRRLLGGEPQLAIDEAADGHAALAALRNARPDLVILDLNLPGIGGLELIGRLRLAQPGLRILVVSMHDAPIYAARALEAGALGYVSKNAPPEQVLAAVRRVAAGQVYIEQDIAQQLALRNLGGGPPLLETLSPRDVEILRRLGEGSSLAEIARGIGVSYKTVANHCSQLKTKLATPRLADLIRLAIASGISSTPPVG